MAFLCPVRIRNSSSGGRKKKQASTAEGGKKRSFLSATVNSIINGDSENDRVNENNNTTTATGGSSSSVGGIPTGPGRITGSSSIETLVRVGLEKEAGQSGVFKLDTRSLSNDLHLLRCKYVICKRLFYRVCVGWVN